MREVCRSHAQDEIIHASQFRALAQWLWGEFDELTRLQAASFLTASTIARNLPDIKRLIFFLHQATGMTIREASEAILTVYSPSVLLTELKITAKPTIVFLQELGCEHYVPISDALINEEQRVTDELFLIRDG